MARAVRSSNLSGDSSVLPYITIHCHTLPNIPLSPSLTTSGRTIDLHKCWPLMTALALRLHTRGAEQGFDSTDTDRLIIAGYLP